MKPFFRIFLLATLVLVGINSAEAQIRIGVDGIEFLGVNDADSLSVDNSQKKSLQASSIMWVQTKPRRQFSIGRRALSTIPMVELGWNVLSNVGYAPYEGMDVGNFLDIRNWKSTQVTVNLLQVAAYDYRSKVGFTLGLGLRANNYRFSKDMSLRRDGGIVMPYKIADVTDRGVKKSKFNIASVHIPAEVMFGNPGRFAFSVGGYVDMVMNSHTKIKYHGGKKDKEHNLPVNFIQAGATVRATFRWFSVYATYQPTQIFKTGRGPEAQQWTIGIGF